MADDQTDIPLKWSAQFTVVYSSRSETLPGDKLILPATALEQLLAASNAASSSEQSTAQQENTPFDPWNTNYSSQAPSRQQRRLPDPLTFRLVNPATSHVVYAGVQEFSAEQDEVILSPFLQSALGLTPRDTTADHVPVEQPLRLTVHTTQLPKGQYVKLRPLEAGYDPADWKALLEQHLRSNYTTLTAGQVLVVPDRTVAVGLSREYSFLIDGFKPAGEAICIVDTDLGVDIEALNEEQARETVSAIVAKARKNGAANGNESSSSVGDIQFQQMVSGRINRGEYVDYQIESWPRSQDIRIALESDTAGDEDQAALALLVSPFSARQRTRPRELDFVFGELSPEKSKSIPIASSNVDLQDAESLWITVWSFKTESDSMQDDTPACSFSLRVTLDDNETVDTDGAEASHSENETQCPNCHQWIPKASLLLHENFCKRNNILCSQGCGRVFQKASSTYKSHWHCPHDNSAGDGTLSHTQHDYIFHPSAPLRCDRCSTRDTFPTIPLLAQHHVTICPSKPILCRFCHLVVPQEGDPDNPSAETWISGLTHHELQDGSRTTECHLCNRITRLRDLPTHLKHHDQERKSRPRPRPCRNVNCGRTLDGPGHRGGTIGTSTSTETKSTSTSTGMSSGTTGSTGPTEGTTLGLCNACFAPLYASLYDPENKALLRRVERRYLQQLTRGCGREWCRNVLCKTGRQYVDGAEERGDGSGSEAQSSALKVAPAQGAAAVVSPKDALAMIKPLVTADVLLNDQRREMYLCADSERTQRWRRLASLLEAEMALSTPSLNSMTATMMASGVMTPGTMTSGTGTGMTGQKEVQAQSDQKKNKKGYDIAWCIAALEDEDGDVDKARAWLGNWAPRRDEEIL